MKPGRVRLEAPTPLRPPDGEGTNFAVFAENATRVELCLFARIGSDEIPGSDSQTAACLPRFRRTASG